MCSECMAHTWPPSLCCIKCLRIKIPICPILFISRDFLKLYQFPLHFFMLVLHTDLLAHWNEQNDETNLSNIGIYKQIYKENLFRTTYAEIDFMNSFHTINTEVVEKVRPLLSITHNWMGLQLDSFKCEEAFMTNIV